MDRRALLYLAGGVALGGGGLYAYQHPDAVPVRIVFETGDSATKPGGGTADPSEGVQAQTAAPDQQQAAKTTATPRPTPTPEQSPAVRTFFNEQATAQLIHQTVNEHRQVNNLGTLQFNAKLTKVAEYHATDMVRRGYFAHEAPDGETLRDRFEKFNVECSVDTGQAIAYGAENLAATWWNTPVETGEGTKTFDTPTELAEGIFNQWLHSREHRNNMYQSYWGREGIALAAFKKRGNVKVYAVQVLC